MQIHQICVLGGSGFIGSALVHRLSTNGYWVKVLTRRRESAKSLILLPNVQVEECNVLDDNALQAHLLGMDAVINLIGILHQDKENQFLKLHAELPRRLAQHCQDLGISRLLHMSALQASTEAASAYLRSKAEGEMALQAFSEKIDITIFQPSVVFGRDDRFLNLFAGLVKLLPVILLAKPEVRFQPIWVEDLAEVMVRSLQNISTFGHSYPLGGPRVYRLRDLMEFVMFVLGKKRSIVGLNDTLSYWQAYAMEMLPNKLMTRDNIDSMAIDSVCDGAFPSVFGLQPTALEAVVPEYLANDTPRAAYDRYRSQAGRDADEWSA